MRLHSSAPLTCMWPTLMRLPPLRDDILNLALSIFWFVSLSGDHPLLCMTTSVRHHLLQATEAQGSLHAIGHCALALLQNALCIPLRTHTKPAISDGIYVSISWTATTNCRRYLPYNIPAQASREINKHTAGQIKIRKPAKQNNEHR